MKVVVPIKTNNQVDEHFGHCEAYNVYTILDNKEIQEMQSLDASVEGCGCKSNIANVLAARGVTVMLAGGIGSGAMNVLNGAGIEVVRGCSGDATEVVKKYLEGLVTDSGTTCAGHDSDHVCSH